MSLQEFASSIHCTSRLHCSVCRDLAGGRATRTSIAAAFGIQQIDWDCPAGMPWLSPGQASAAAEASARAAQHAAARLAAERAPVSEEEARRRFDICRSCEQADDGGFACRLIRTCCFGRYRSRQGSRCPLGRWKLSAGG
jgi:hypothetical protein